MSEEERQIRLKKQEAINEGLAALEHFEETGDRSKLRNWAAKWPQEIEEAERRQNDCLQSSSEKVF